MDCSFNGLRVDETARGVAASVRWTTWESRLPAGGKEIGLQAVSAPSESA
jgi:hypothetical protein